MPAVLGFGRDGELGIPIRSRKRHGPRIGSQRAIVGMQSAAVPRMDWLGWVQWPAMAVTLLAGWLVASKGRLRRRWGFAMFILSNVLWIVWGWHTQSFALVALQVGLFFMNMRGEEENSDDAAVGSPASAKEARAENAR